eukprot:TRINITY_DN7341_c0_g1_i1.p1 TRINITY_DN7341_c0_g1~~TRINITY_DN7341_c0_g1_i1.p1  ORF type:complete len:301 (+),score=56.53 TRINITY_DN7341_c0_g1_i1:81-905(+)
MSFRHLFALTFVRRCASPRMFCTASRRSHAVPVARKRSLLSFDSSQVRHASFMRHLPSWTMSPALTMGRKKAISGGKSSGKGKPSPKDVSSGDVDADDILLPIEKKMSGNIAHLEQQLSEVRTGRAAPGLLDNVVVDAYGNDTPIQSVGQVVVKDGQTLLVHVFDANLTKAVVAGIEKADLGLNPQIERESVRVAVPKMTKEYRQTLVKLVTKQEELTKVKIRSQRKGGMDAIKKSGLGEDDKKPIEKKLQAATDSYIKQVTELCRAKEKDLAE